MNRDTLAPPSTFSSPLEISTLPSFPLSLSLSLSGFATSLKSTIFLSSPLFSLRICAHPWRFSCSVIWYSWPSPPIQVSFWESSLPLHFFILFTGFHFKPFCNLKWDFTASGIFSSSSFLHFVHWLPFEAFLQLKMGFYTRIVWTLWRVLKKSIEIRKETVGSIFFWSFW